MLVLGCSEGGSLDQFCSVGSAVRFFSETSAVRRLLGGRLSSAREFGGGAYVRELRCFPESGQSRVPRSWDGAPAIFPRPGRNDRTYGTGDSRLELVGDHAGGTRGAVAKRDDALREVATSFSFSFGFV